MAEPLFLLDSNILIYVLEGKGSSLRDRVENWAPGQVVTSAICAAEVLRGIRADDAKRMERAQRLFVLIEPLPFDREAALACQRIPFRRGSFDRLIAAHALSLDLVLITSNEADFADVPGLRVENWTLPL